MNRYIVAFLACIVFLLGTHGIKGVESVNTKLTRLFAQAKQGDAEAQVSLGWIYCTGIMGVAEDDCEAVKWYRLAAEGENRDGLIGLGTMYSNGKAIKCEASKWRKQMAEYGDAKAQYWRKLWEGAERGDVAAQYEFGWLYYVGEGVAADKQKVAKWWRRAAEEGHADAQFYLGWMYDYGIEFAEDDCEAAKWFERADSQKRHVDAVASLLLMWYEFNDQFSEKGVAVPDCESLDFVKYPF